MRGCGCGGADYPASTNSVGANAAPVETLVRGADLGWCGWGHSWGDLFSIVVCAGKGVRLVEASDGGEEGSCEVLELVDPQHPDAGHHEDSDHDEQGAADEVEDADVASNEGQCGGDSLNSERDEDERYAQAEAVDEPQERATPRCAGRGAQGQDSAEGGAHARRPTQTENDTEQGRAGDAGAGPPRHLGGPLEER